MAKTSAGMQDLSPSIFYHSSSCNTSNGVFTPEQDNDKTNVEPVHSYDAFHTRSVLSLPDLV